VPRAAASVSTPRVLFICHNHPAVRPGGAEAYALELHRHLRATGAADSLFLAKGGPPMSAAGRAHLGTCIAPAGRAPDEYLCFTEDWDYDWTFGSIRDDKRLYTQHLRAFLKAVNPEVVHFHHTMFFGYDVLREVRNTLPDVPIFYTLHEFMPICHRQGQMLKIAGDEPCMEESPRNCHECFPDVTPQIFFLRKRFIQSHFSVVDRFIAPSAFLGDRYVEWGIPREKVVVEEYGRTLAPLGEAPAPRAVRNRFGFFGQLTPYKGLQVVLEAVVHLQGGRAAHQDPLFAALAAAAGGNERNGDAVAETDREPVVRVHGANLDLQPGQFQNHVKDLLAQTKDRVTFIGRYRHEDLSAHMAEVDWIIVPSIWWENSPLVIQEAFHFGKPVICSDIGGMAEKVRDGIDGLHFRANDPTSLAAVMKRVAETDGLWGELHRQVRPVYPMDTHVQHLMSMYNDLLKEKRTANAA
jgi:glycosyltransferase involved in cell wall biosynthesis